MSGPGHPYPGGFPGGPPPPSAMRNAYASPQMNPMAGMMNGQMVNMGQPYGNNMQNPMGNMGINNQSMVVGNPAPSPNQGMGMMGMQSSMGGAGNMGGNMASPGMGSVMSNAPMSSGMGMVNSPMGQNSGMQTSMNVGVVGGPNSSPMVNQNVQANNQNNQAAAQPQQNKEFNTASLCRFGQETVQDIVSRTQEVFQTLKAIHPPNGTQQGLNSSNEKKAKIQEQLRTIRLLFKRLRLIYEKCNENCQVPGMEYTHIESLIPLKEEYEPKTIDEKTTSEAYKVVCEENKELTEQVVLKNKQLKEVINNLRTIIWEINVMLSMRRS